RVLIWDIDANQRLTTLDLPFVLFPQVRLAPNGRTVLVWDVHTGDGTFDGGGFRLFDVRSGDQLFAWERPLTSSNRCWDGGGSFSPDGKMLALSIDETRIDLVEIATGRGRVAGRVRCGGAGRGRVGRLGLSGEGRPRVAVNEAGLAQHWDLSERAAPRSVMVRSSSLAGLHATSDGRVLVAGWSGRAFVLA